MSEISMVRIPHTTRNFALTDEHLAAEDFKIEGTWIVMSLDDFAYMADVREMDYDAQLEELAGQEFLRTVPIFA